MLKALTGEGILWLTRVCQVSSKHGKTPRDWQTGVIFPIFKKGDRKQCTNYRGISLLKRMQSKLLHVGVGLRQQGCVSSPLFFIIDINRIDKCSQADECSQDEELDTRIRKASSVMRALHYSVVMKRELSKKAKLSIFKTVFVPVLIYGHESCVMTERVRSLVQASKVIFLQKNRRSYTA